MHNKKNDVILISKKGADPDRIPLFLVKECANKLSQPLFIIYNKSLSEGTFPSVWKSAH